MSIDRREKKIGNTISYNQPTNQKKNTCTVKSPLTTEFGKTPKITSIVYIQKNCKTKNNRYSVLK